MGSGHSLRELRNDRAARPGMTTESAVGERRYWVYLMASRPNGTLYLGVTNNLSRRAYEHRTKAIAGFSEKYDVAKLVWYEEYSDINEAIAREKQLKKWRRGWKVRLIMEMNPEWDDLYEGLA